MCKGKGNQKRDLSFWIWGKLLRIIGKGREKMITKRRGGIKQKQKITLKHEQKISLIRRAIQLRIEVWVRISLINQMIRFKVLNSNPNPGPSQNL